MNIDGEANFMSARNTFMDMSRLVRSSTRAFQCHIWELSTYVAAIAWLLPRTFLNKIILLPAVLLLRQCDVLPKQGGTADYALIFIVGFCLLLILVLSYVFERVCSKSINGVQTLYVDALAMLCCLFLTNYLTTSIQPFSFEYCWWPLYILINFFVIIFYFDRAHALRLVYFILIVITIQSVYAIWNYSLGISQFHTPGFGNRTCGTFASPCTLYPVCLIALLLSISLFLGSSHIGHRICLMFCLLTNFLALIFTYNRAGWIALAFSIVYLAILSYPTSLTISYQKWWRVTAVVTIIFLLVGAAFIRTKGEMIGSRQDRSFWGRVAIWNVAGHTLIEHPLVGGGLGSYAAVQSSYMTLQLSGFNPHNAEPESLYLSIASELGGVGMMILIILALRYAQMISRIRQICLIPSSTKIIVIGLHATIIALSVASVVDTPILEPLTAPSTFVLFCLLGSACVLLSELPIDTVRPQLLQNASSFEQGVD